MARDTKPAKLDPLAHAELENLKKALRSQGLPRNIEGVDILSALVLYTSVPQIAWMLREYWRYTEAQDQAAAEDS
jgi:hypothetical protein